MEIPAAQSLQELIGSGSSSPNLILNLTNPAAHFEVSRACLQAGKHVYSEKPLAMDMSSARELCALAGEKSLLLASAPCSVLGEAAQTLWRALRLNVVGKMILFTQSLTTTSLGRRHFAKWHSELGAPWPYQDEFSVGCTLEHAGYYLTWLMAMYGSVEKVISASATLVEDKATDVAQTAPDYSCATLFFNSGVVTRLTCSIVAPHDHSLRIIGDTGVLEIDRSWDNQAAVRLRRRFAIRRKLLNSPIARRIQIKGPSHPKVGRWGAAAMNFALGPAEMLSALREKRKCRLSADFALHLNEVTLAIQSGKGLEYMQTTCPPMDPMPWAQD